MNTIDDTHLIKGRSGKQVVEESNRQQLQHDGEHAAIEFKEMGRKKAFFISGKAILATLLAFFIVLILRWS